MLGVLTCTQEIQRQSNTIKEVDLGTCILPPPHVPCIQHYRHQLQIPVFAQENSPMSNKKSIVGKTTANHRRS